MTNQIEFSEDKLLGLIARGRHGFNAFCATLDLLGVSSMMANKPDEARARLNDLQQGFGETLIFFPGGKDYRVCFAGDSLFVVKELSPDDNWLEDWPNFCGHIFAMASMLHDMEVTIGNPGLRVIISYGQLLQLREPDSWREEPLSEFTNNWLVLTGASDALIKCTEAEKSGRRGGFDGKYCWHEHPEEERKYLGTPLLKIPIEFCWQPSLYRIFYHEMVEKSGKHAVLAQPDA